MEDDSDNPSAAQSSQESDIGNDSDNPSAAHSLQESDIGDDSDNPPAAHSLQESVIEQDSDNPPAAHSLQESDLEHDMEIVETLDLEENSPDGEETSNFNVDSPTQHYPDPRSIDDDLESTDSSDLEVDDVDLRGKKL